MHIVARNLIKIRNEFNLTTKKLASMVKYSYSFLKDVEHGRSQLSVTSIMNISKTLGIKPSYFFLDPDEDLKVSESDMIQRIAYLDSGREILEELKDIDKLDDSQRHDILTFIRYIKSKDKPVI